MADDPHQNQPVMAAGLPLEEAHAAMIMLHGRGAPAHDILSLSREIDQGDFAYFAPEAAGYAWYPFSFMEPTDNNEPYLSSALAFVDRLVTHITDAGIAHDRIMLLGFSQGACLSVEYAARYARRYGGLAVLSGGLIGDRLNPDHYGESLDGTPVFIGCSDIDPHIPRTRVSESAKLLETRGAQVSMRLYPNMGHTINQDEIDHVRGLMRGLIDSSPADGG